MKTKRFISMLLAAIMILSAMSVTAFAEELVCELEEHTHEDACRELICENTDAEHVHADECYQLICTKEEHAHSEDCYVDENTIYVSTIDITVAAPAVGEQVADVESFDIDAYLDEIGNVHTKWFENATTDDSADENWLPMADEDVFEENMYYLVQIMWEYPEDVVIDENVAATVNSNKAFVIIDEGNESLAPSVGIEYIFGQLVADEDDSDNDVVVTNVAFEIDEPVVGAQPYSDFVVTLTPDVELDVDAKGIEWSENTGEDEYFFTDMEGAFEDGVVYAALFSFKVPDGVVFADDCSATVNGEEIAPENFGHGEGQYNNYYFAASHIFDNLVADDGGNEDEVPTIIDGANGEWKDNSEEGLSFTSDAKFADFNSVKVDGEIIDAENYTVEEGSTVVVLKASYLKTLKVGKHDIAIVSANGEAETEFDVVHVHVLKKIEEKDPTCVEKGYEEHYTCECGVLFEDEDGETEIDAEDIEIKAAGHTASKKWTRDHKYHWHKCTVCDEIADEKEKHDWDKTGKICEDCDYDVDDPQTGDEFNMSLMIVLMIVSVVGMSSVACVYNKKRK